MYVARKNRNAPGRSIHSHAHDGEPARSGHIGAKVDAHLAGLSAALELEIRQPRVQGQFGIGRGARAIQNLQRQRAVGCNPHHAAVFKLDLGLAVVGSRQLHAFKQRRIGHSLRSQHLIALRQLHLAFDKTQPHRACGLSCPLLSILGRCHGRQRSYSQGQRCQPCICFAVPHEIHGAPPFPCLAATPISAHRHPNTTFDTL